MDPALRVDLEYRCHARQHSLASVRGRIELEPRNVIRGLARRLGYDFGAHCTAVGVLPVRASVMAPDRLAFEPERRCRLSKGPGELAVTARLALVQLAPFGVCPSRRE